MQAYKYNTVIVDDAGLKSLLKRLRPHLKFGFYIESQELSDEETRLILDSQKEKEYPQKKLSAAYIEMLTAKFNFDKKAKPPFNMVTLYGPKRVEQKCSGQYTFVCFDKETRRLCNTPSDYKKLYSKKDAQFILEDKLSNPIGNIQYSIIKIPKA